MENNQEYYCTYKFYDERGRHLAVFSRKVDDSTLEIFIEKCSKKDQFSKSYARNVYNIYRISLKVDEKGGIYEAPNHHPEIFTIPIPEGSGPKFTMLRWCRENLCVRIDDVEYKLKPVFLKATEVNNYLIFRAKDLKKKYLDGGK